MEITFIGHSTIIVWTNSGGILCDPWLEGRVFNNGWALNPNPVFDPEMLDRISYIWVSHEHPDHLNFPTLSNFPDDFKSRVTVIFQKTNSSKIKKSLKSISYRNFIDAPHRSRIFLGTDNAPSSDWISVYQHRHIDSVLIVGQENGPTIVNVNDAELTDHDCKILNKQFGPFDVTFKQFSIAGFQGMEDILEQDSKKILQNMLDQHSWLEAKVTCPIASFMYFCRPDNSDLNRFANTALDVLKVFRRERLSCHLLFPGTTRKVQQFQNDEGDIEAFRTFYTNLNLPIDPLEDAVKFDDIKGAFIDRIRDWKCKHSKILVNKIGSIPIHVSDMGKTYEFDFRALDVRMTDKDPLITINSQPLFFAFAAPFGIQTLGVSGRYRMREIPFEWKLVRVLSSLYNSEIYLKPRYLFTSRFLGWLLTRLPDLVPTIRQQVGRFSQPNLFTNSRRGS